MIRISRYHHSKTKEGEDRRDDEKGGNKMDRIQKNVKSKQVTSP
jgi:hypothetical protein